MMKKIKSILVFRKVRKNKIQRAKISLKTKIILKKKNYKKFKNKENKVILLV